MRLSTATFDPDLVEVLPRPRGLSEAGLHKVAAALCAVPPLVLTALVRDTAFVFSLCGLSGFAIVFFVPAALQRAALRASVRRWGRAGRATPHTTCLSGDAAVFGVCAFAAAAFAFNVWSLFLSKLFAG